MTNWRTSYRHTKYSGSKRKQVCNCQSFFTVRWHPLFFYDYWDIFVKLPLMLCFISSAWECKYKTFGILEDINIYNLHWSELIKKAVFGRAKLNGDQQIHRNDTSWLWIKKTTHLENKTNYCSQICHELFLRLGTLPLYIKQQNYDLCLRCWYLQMFHNLLN